MVFLKMRISSIPGNQLVNKIPAAPSLVVSGLNFSDNTVTEQKGRASAMHTAVERPTTPAPTTATLTLVIADRTKPGTKGAARRLPLWVCKTQGYFMKTCF